MKATELQATTQKSYYGKAKVRTENGCIILTSYTTDVAMIDISNNTFHRLWSGYSVTTMNHINDFRMQNGFTRISKREWLSLPCESEQNSYNVYF